MVVSGSCLCGAAAYEYEGTLTDGGHCHCSMCRKEHGAAFGSYAMVDADRFRWVSGEDAVSRFESSPGEHRLFCRVCGSTLGYMSKGRILAITPGTLDGEPEVRLVSHIFVGSKASWHEILDDLPQFDENPESDTWI